jgi:protein involved in polysaccharide export with SLBB domain
VANSLVFKPSRRAALLALFSLSGCRAVQGSGPGVDSTNPSVARASEALPASALGPGDVFEVRVFQEADLSGAFRVGPDGTVEFPLCKTVKVGGLTANGAATAITDCLRGRFFKNPQVTVFLRELNSRKLFLFGEVQKPGTYPFEDNISVVQAIALAGGFTRQAAKNGAIVTRRASNGEEERIKVPLGDVMAGLVPDFKLLPGDIVFVPESLF